MTKKRKGKVAPSNLIKEDDWKSLAATETEEDRYKVWSSALFTVHNLIVEQTKKKNYTILTTWLKKHCTWDIKEQLSSLTETAWDDIDFWTKNAYIHSKLGWMPKDINDSLLEQANIMLAKKEQQKILKKEALQKELNLSNEQFELLQKEKQKRKPSIQQLMHEQLAGIYGEWDHFYDCLTVERKASLQDFNPYNDMMINDKIKPKHASMIKEYYLNDLAEAKKVQAWQKPTVSKEVIDGETVEIYDEAADIREAYSFTTKQSRQDSVDFYEKIINACNAIIKTGQTQRKTRKPKPISKEKLVAKMKYRVNDGDLGLSSISPADIINAEEVWVFNTKSRKLGVYKTAPAMPGLTVKGTTLKNFDEASSVQKTIRKPQEQLKLFKGNAKNKWKKLFDGIKAVDTKLNGRINNDIIILKAFHPKG